MVSNRLVLPAVDKLTSILSLNVLTALRAAEIIKLTSSLDKFSGFSVKT